MNRGGRLPAAVLVACAALAAGCGVVVAAGAMHDQANFCDGTYALCIKAPCAAIPTLDRLGNYVSDHALCVCDVVKGWSMGPGGLRRSRAGPA